jgi:hypothetical protein
VSAPRVSASFGSASQVGSAEGRGSRRLLRRSTRGVDGSLLRRSTRGVDGSLLRRSTRGVDGSLLRRSSRGVDGRA